MPDLAGVLDNRFDSQIADVDGQQIHYVRGGRGPTVVLLHGFPQDWYEWREVMVRLVDSYDVIAVDQRGVGQSGPARRGYDAATLAGDVRALLQLLAVDRAHIVGHDIGGWVAYAFARRFPAATQSLVIIETLLPGVDPFANPGIDVPLWHAQFHMVPGLPEALVTGRQVAYFTYFFDVGTERPGVISDDDVAHYAWAYRDPDHLAPAFDTYRAMPANVEFAADHVDPFDPPVLLIGGELVFGPPLVRTAESLREQFGCRDVRTVVLDLARHYLPEDRPDEIANLIDRHAGG